MTVQLDLLDLLADLEAPPATGVHSLAYDERATIRHIDATSYRHWICYLIGHPDGPRKPFAHHEPEPTGWTTTGTTITYDGRTHSIADWRAWAASLPATLRDRARQADEQDDTEAAAQVVAEAINMSPTPAFGDTRHIAKYPQPDTCTTYPTASTRNVAGACAGCPCWRNRPFPGPRRK